VSVTETPTVETPDEPPRRPPVDKAARNRRLAIEWTILIVAALVIAFLIKTFLFQAFYIPSGSMEPTLKIGDRVLVNKVSYDLHDVHRGDIIVFKAPENAGAGDIKDLVKRVIGLPGDVLESRDETGAVCEEETHPGCHVYVNDRRLDEPYVHGQSTDFLPRTKVPAGHLFMMGDNREFSHDSRYFGSIEKSAVIGRVFVRIWPPQNIGLF
jgi:signal peptidase I